MVQRRVRHVGSPHPTYFYSHLLAETAVFSSITLNPTHADGLHSHSRRRYGHRGFRDGPTRGQYAVRSLQQFLLSLTLT